MRWLEVLLEVYELGRGVDLRCVGTGQQQDEWLVFRPQFVTRLMLIMRWHQPCLGTTLLPMTAVCAVAARRAVRDLVPLVEEQFAKHIAG